MKIKMVVNLITPEETSDGAGVRLKRGIGSRYLTQIDPFLLFDEFRSDDPGDYIGGFPSHPHRGFETVTYMLAGVMKHSDSTGESGILSPGSIQWMTAGSGVIHSELPQTKDGLMWGFQLWINLPRAEKMSDPKYRNITPDMIPSAPLDGGGNVKVIAGEFGNSKGAVRGITAEPRYFDVSLTPSENARFAIPPGHTAFAYTLGGEVSFGGGFLPVSRLAVFGDGDEVVAKAGTGGSRFLLISGKPFNEPISRLGPFVMNTDAEIREAFRDYNDGTLVRKKNKDDRI